MLLVFIFATVCCTNRMLYDCQIMKSTVRLCCTLQSKWLHDCFLRCVCKFISWERCPNSRWWVLHLLQLFHLSQLPVMGQLNGRHFRLLFIETLYFDLEAMGDEKILGLANTEIQKVQRWHDRNVQQILVNMTTELVWHHYSFSSDLTRGNDMKLAKSHVRYDIRKHFFHTGGVCFISKRFQK